MEGHTPPNEMVPYERVSTVLDYTDKGSSKNQLMVAQVGFEPTSQPYEGRKETSPLPRYIG